jgi:hypothetical protein
MSDGITARALVPSGIADPTSPSRITDIAIRAKILIILLMDIRTSMRVAALV